MKARRISNRLRQQKIRGRRTTINGAFWSAIAPFENFRDSREKVEVLLQILGKKLDDELECVYCGEPADHFDHLYSIVKDGRFQGFGHLVFNSVPSCSRCNVNKQDKHWKDWLLERHGTNVVQIEERTATLKRIDDLLQLEETVVRRSDPAFQGDLTRYMEIMREVDTLLGEADQIAENIQKVRRK